MSKVRTAILGLVLSATGLTYIAQREDYRGTAYPDSVHGLSLIHI